MDELVFNVTQEPDGAMLPSLSARASPRRMDTWDELCHMVLGATRGYFYDLKPPARIRLFLHIEQVLAVA
jgi:hypothetical protein